jgi:fructokinase
MIAVAGEALIDLVTGHDGIIRARPGGGPFNTARTISRLGQPCTFLGRLSDDGFGRDLARRLSADGVTLAVPGPVPAPSTLAVVDVDARGLPQYRFYLTGTSSSVLDYEAARAALPATLTALHVGTLALVMEPIAATIEQLINTDATPDTLVMVDPNCRPGAITDEHAYRSRLARLLRRTDVVKVSAEDLAYLCPGMPPRTAAAGLLDQGPALVLLTDGPRTAHAFLPAHELSVDVPYATVVDTIGAGDAFGGAFLAWWAGNGRTRSDLADPDAVRAALQLATQVAALSCTRAGADPPWAAELDQRDWDPNAPESPAGPRGGGQ